MLGWGERGQLHLGKVLDLRRQPGGQIKTEDDKKAEDLHAALASTDSDDKAEAKAEAGSDPAPPATNDNAAQSEAVTEQLIVKKEQVEAEEPTALPPQKKVKLEHHKENDEWDDGGIQDDDLVGVGLI